MPEHRPSAPEEQFADQSDLEALYLDAQSAIQDYGVPTATAGRTSSGRRQIIHDRGTGPQRADLTVVLAADIISRVLPEAVRALELQDRFGATYFAPKLEETLGPVGLLFAFSKIPETGLRSEIILLNKATRGQHVGQYVVSRIRDELEVKPPDSPAEDIVSSMRRALRARHMEHELGFANTITQSETEALRNIMNNTGKIRSLGGSLTDV